MLLGNSLLGSTVLGFSSQVGGGESLTTYAQIVQVAISVATYSPEVNTGGNSFPEAVNIAVTPSTLKAALVPGSEHATVVVSIASPVISIITEIPQVLISVSNFAPNAEGFFKLDLRPGYIFPGYTFDGTNILIPLESLVWLSPDKAHMATGSWPDIFQAMLMQLQSQLDSIPFIHLPRALRLLMLEDWNRKDSRFGRHMKRLFLVEFTVENAPTNIFDTE